ncbi:YwpF-like protein [Alteribacillus persepolensis]|uniref:YwpF-like protein n=1 Tax=Alteribacillus persepolensis TaxID=568899 RepID=A0A1G8E1T4_9BACI|nr:YwpF family protein [Alteribacillus persepolensis]SDH63854.1 YwpF-like protein [Alteribacillus persepolensis]
MKTFRLISLKVIVLENQTFVHHDIPISDGLIINREEAGSSWLIEAMVPSSEKAFISSLYDQQLVFEAMITERSNEPALMSGQVRDVISLSKGYSILIDAKMAAGKDEVSTLILESLIEDGFSGEALLQEFTSRKGDQAEWAKKMAEKMYKNT